MEEGCGVSKKFGGFGVDKRNMVRFIYSVVTKNSLKGFDK